MPSALYSSNYSATANNILNKFDASPIYDSATGAWNFEDSSGNALISATTSAIALNKATTVSAGNTALTVKSSTSTSYMLFETSAGVKGTIGATATKLQLYQGANVLLLEGDSTGAVSIPTNSSSLTLGTTASANYDFIIRAGTANAADYARVIISGGGDSGAGRGAQTQYAGNENTALGANTGGTILSIMGEGSAASFDVWSSSLVSCFKVSQAGAVTVGPVAGLSGSLTHELNCTTSAGPYGLKLIKKTGADSTSNYYIGFFAGTGTTEQGGIWNNGSGNLELFTSSDERIKSDIRDATYGLAEVLALRPRLFTKEGISDVKGFIAQEVKEILPESVGIRESNGFEDFHTLSTQTMIPVLVQAVKELHAQLLETRAELAALRAS